MDAKNLDTPAAVFAVPRPLFAGRKRRAEAGPSGDSSQFFSADEFAAFSVRGDAHESRLYGELETRRRTIVSSVGSANRGTKSSAAMQIKKRTKHLVQLLMEAIEGDRIQRPDNMTELENGRRRVSGFSVAEHEQYLMLQRKLFQAQQHGLPELLALSQEEAKQWNQMKYNVQSEQVGFCRMLARGLAVEAAANDAQVPPFVASWYDAMLTQCWNDVYRLYPRWFEPCVAVQMPCASASAANGSAVVKAKEVASRGMACVIDVRKLAAGQSLRVSPSEGGELVLDVVSPRQAISTDPEAERLMEQYDCDIAVSSSTLVTLFDSDTSARFAHVPASWAVPMKSREFIHGSSGASKKRVFLDRPLPGSNPGTREKEAEAGRAALLSRFEAESIAEGSTGGRTAYYVWHLDDKRVLVRSTTQASMAVPPPSESAQEVTQEQQNTKQKTAPLSVFVKPDYHLLGLEEQLTTSERCRFWLHSWLRGGSTVLVARINPKQDAVSSWKTYSPASLIYGDQTLPLECFDPSSKFQWLSMLFTTLGDIPVGNYLLRPQDSPGSSTFGKKRLGVEVLMVAAERGVESVDLYTFMPRTSPREGAANTLSTSDADLPPSSVLPAWNLRDRIPYTFQTGMYCVPFFLEGMCPNVSKGEGCDHIHLRLPEQKVGAKKPARAKRWRFENYTKVLKKAARTNFEVLNRPKPITLSYAFCGEEKAPPSVTAMADLYAGVHCSKPSAQCSLPHLTLHQILERLADDLLRKGRGKRRAQKTAYRSQQRETAEPPCSSQC